MTPRRHYGPFLSLGAGVQSSSLALMAAAGEIGPMPLCAIFADTQGEPASVYKWLDWLETQLPFPVYRVTAGSLADAALRVRTRADGARRYQKSAVPAYILKPNGKAGMLRRQCTQDFKLAPIKRKILGMIGRRGIATTWLGISIDEAHRMKPSRVGYIVNEWPLIERGISRAECLAWMEAKGYPKPPRSACVYCPYHSDAEWARLDREEPEAIQKAAEFESAYQKTLEQVDGIDGVPFLHRSLLPVLNTPWRGASGSGDLWAEECEGMCGV